MQLFTTQTALLLVNTANNYSGTTIVNEEGKGLGEPYGRAICRRCNPDAESGKKKTEIGDWHHIWYDFGLSK